MRESLRAHKASRLPPARRPPAPAASRPRPPRPRLGLVNARVCPWRRRLAGPRAGRNKSATPRDRGRARALIRPPAALKPSPSIRSHGSVRNARCHTPASPAEPLFTLRRTQQRPHSRASAAPPEPLRRPAALASRASQSRPATRPLAASLLAGRDSLPPLPGAAIGAAGGFLAGCFRHACVFCHPSSFHAANYSRDTRTAASLP